MRTVRARGFTIIEVMLVVLIIGIISSLAIPYYLNASARAYRSEMNVVLSKMRVYFVNLYENQGTFLAKPGGVNAGTGFTAPFNPTDASRPVGQSATWNPTAAGWTDMTFPPEGGIRMRYSYTVLSDQMLLFQVCGNFPGFGPLADCGDGVNQGNYFYSETLNGPTTVSVAEYPQSF